MRGRSRSQTRKAGRWPGFTLIELMIVVVIIGILIAFILTAAMEGVRRAEERATQSLIAKLDTGMSDRIEAILGTRADALISHDRLAGVWVTTTDYVRSNMRAQTIARFDQVAAEIPDVFVVQAPPSGLGSPYNYYPLNFGAPPFPGGTASGALPADAKLHAHYVLPMGVAIVNDPTIPSYGCDPSGNTVIPPTGTGIYGASYSAAAGLYKSLFEKAVLDNPSITLPSPRNAGFDGVDNNNNGLIDELGENGPAIAAYIANTLLPRHTHKTARAEVLYALLVEGQGPFGSVFSRDDFTDAEVKDTDGDGLPEFVDAWGEPLQFYRWPIFFTSDAQKGAATYINMSALAGASVSYESRQQDTLDPNQTLVDPSWWSGAVNANSPFGKVSAPLSGAAVYFQSFFHSVTDPNALPSLSASQGQVWDRGAPGSSFFARRAFQSRHLILSGGPDKAPGVPVFDRSYSDSIMGYVADTKATILPPYVPVVPIGGVGTPDPTLLRNLRIECQAARANPNRTNDTYLSFSGLYDKIITLDAAPPSDPVSVAIQEAGNDDIHSHNLNGPGGATQ